MTEADLVWRIKIAAASRGILVREERDVVRCAHCNHMTPCHNKAGWPDLTLVGTKILYREIKIDAGRLSAAQEAIGNAISWGEGSWDIWREEDYNSGIIARELDEIRMY